MRNAVCLVIVLTMCIFLCTPASADESVNYMFVVPYRYQEGSDFSDGLAFVRSGTFSAASSGYIDTSGKVVVPIQNRFIMPKSFSEGLAMVTLRSSGDVSSYPCGFIDRTGNEVIPFEYNIESSYYGGYFSEGLAKVYNDPGKPFFIDKSGNVVLPYDGSVYYKGKEFSEGLLVVSRDGKDGYIDKSGNIVIPFEYDDACNFSEGLAAVVRDGKLGFIDKTGNVIIPFEYDKSTTRNLEYEYYYDNLGFSEGLAAVSRDYKWGYIDKSGNVAIPFVYDSAYDFSESRALVAQEADDRYGYKYGFVNTTGNLVVPLIYDIAYSFSEGLAAVSFGDPSDSRTLRSGYIDKMGNVIIPFDFAFAFPFADGVARVANEEKVNVSNVSTGYITLTEAGHAAVSAVAQSTARPSEQTVTTDGIKVILDGKRLVFDVPPQNVNGRMLVPLRAIFEEMSASIDYDPATQTVTATKEDTVVVLTIGGTSPTINGVIVSIDQPGIIVDGRTLAPLRFVAEAFGGTVAWDGTTQTATIMTREEI